LLNDQSGLVEAIVRYFPGRVVTHTVFGVLSESSKIQVTLNGSKCLEWFGSESI
jgi:hypothetical protein